MIDLTDIFTRQSGRGYELLCPECGKWSRELLILEGDKALCKDCHKGPEKMRSKSGAFQTNPKKGGT